MKLSLALFCYAALIENVSFAQLSAPRAGVVRFADRTLRIVRGVPSNLIVERAPLGAATAASFSDSGGLIAENGYVELVTAAGASVGAYQCAETHPVLNVDGPLTSALAFLPTTQTLLAWDGASFSHIRLSGVPAEGQVSSLRRAGETAQLLVSHANGLVSELAVSLRTGNVVGEDYLPGAHGRAFFQHRWTVSTTASGLVVDGGNEHREFRLSQQPLTADDITIERMSSDWLHISSASSGQHWVLYLSATEMSLSWLPATGVSQ